MSEAVPAILAQSSSQIADKKARDIRTVAYPEVNLGTPQARSASVEKSAGGL